MFGKSVLGFVLAAGVAHGAPSYFRHGARHLDGAGGVYQSIERVTNHILSIFGGPTGAMTCRTGEIVQFAINFNRITLNQHREVADNCDGALAYEFNGEMSNVELEKSQCFINHQGKQFKKLGISAPFEFRAGAREMFSVQDKVLTKGEVEEDNSLEMMGFYIIPLTPPEGCFVQQESGYAAKHIERAGGVFNSVDEVFGLLFQIMRGNTGAMTAKNGVMLQYAAQMVAKSLDEHREDAATCGGHLIFESSGTLRASERKKSGCFVKDQLKIDAGTFWAGEDSDGQLQTVVVENTKPSIVPYDGTDPDAENNWGMYFVPLDDDLPDGCPLKQELGDDVRHLSNNGGVQPYVDGSVEDAYDLVCQVIGGNTGAMTSKNGMVLQFLVNSGGMDLQGHQNVAASCNGDLASDVDGRLTFYERKKLKCFFKDTLVPELGWGPGDYPVRAGENSYLIVSVHDDGDVSVAVDGSNTYDDYDNLPGAYLASLDIPPECPLVEH